jgi:hypothetical protein
VRHQEKTPLCCGILLIEGLRKSTSWVQLCRFDHAASSALKLV